MTYPIPTAALDDRLAWVGTSGSGKTYNAGGGVERLLASKARVVIVDPLDVWWGLRLRPDGAAASKFPVVIFGGAHGDLPLTEQSGAVIGEAVAKASESCIVSLGGFPTKAAERRFMLAFLTALYRHAPGEPLHLVLDEADLWAPQTILDKEGDAQKLKGQMEQIVRRGRVRGFIPWLITQRPAVLSKDVLSQADGLIAFKLTSSQDRDAIGGWIEGQADRAQGKEILASLPTMQQGQGIVWVPGRAVLEAASFPEKATYDSSRTPKRGEVVRTANLKPLDLGALKDRLADVEAEVKASDPKALKAEVARLTREFARLERKKATPPSAPAPVVINAEVVEEARQAGMSEGVSIGLARAMEAILALSGGKLTPPRASRVTTAPKAAPAPVIAADGVTGPQQRILNALAWWKAFGIDQPTNEQIGFIAGYSPSSGGFNNLKGQLRTGGMIDYPQSGRASLTEAGMDKAEAPTVAVTVDAFHAAVRAKLTGPQVKVLDPALTAYPASIGSEEIANIAGYSPSSGGFNNLRGSLRTIGLIDYPSPGQVRASDWLFP